MIRTGILAILLLVLAGTAARADLLPPLPPAKEFKIRIELDPRGKATKVLIPWAAVNERRGRPQPFPPKTGSPEKQTSLNLRWTIIGVSLTLAVAFSGLWFMRRNPSGKIVAGVVAAVGISLGAAAIISANSAPPRVIAELQGYETAAHVEVIASGDAIRIVLDQKMFDRITGKK